MKKSFNVNLGGRIFMMDEDAYEQLNDYLVSVRTCFMNNESGEEIAADIEARMGELFESRMGEGNSRIVTLALVNEMIARMGKPESMIEDELGYDENNTTDDSSERSEEKKTASGDDVLRKMSMGKKLFRDGDNKLLGGVISGLAAYTGVDVVLLRVIAVILFFITVFWTFLLYLVCWAVIPLAVTTTDKLRMNGVEPTPENIAERLTYEEPAIDKIMRNLKEVDNKGIATLLMILGCVLFISMFMTMLAPNINRGYNIGMLPLFLIMGWIGFISLIAIPMVAIVLVLSKRWEMLSASVKWLLLIDWIMAFIQVFVLTSKVQWFSYFTF